MGQRLGQHLLIRGSVLERITRAVCAIPSPVVVEIGPGRGALTRYLLDRVPRLIAIELDEQFCAHLSERYPTLELIRSDVLQVDLTQWSEVTVCGNLPYYITSPILEHTLSLGSLLRHAVFLIQREVAERLIAAPGSRDYGFLSVRTQILAAVKMLFTVPRGAFQPPPAVDSAVVQLIPHPQPLVPDTSAFVRFAGLCFQQKRKNLRNNLRGTWPAIDSMDEATLRAEQLSIKDLAGLFEKLSTSAEVKNP